MLTFDPLPGNYTEETTHVTIDAPPGYTAIFAKGYYPALVQTIASNTVNGVELPFLQTVDNGLGRVILDGAFPRFYNGRLVMDPTHPYNILFRNFLHYLSKKESGRLLVLGDLSAGPDRDEFYTVKGTSSNSFYNTFTQISQWFNFSLTIRDPDDYGGQLNPSFGDLVGYDVIFLMSSRYVEDSPTILSEAAAQHIADLREAGVGVYICTDHGDGPVGFYGSANKLLRRITDAKFIGNHNLSPGTTVGYNRTLHGDSPIFKDLDDDIHIVADNSNSIVEQGPIPQPQTFPITVKLGDGLNDLHLTILTPDGGVVHSRTAYTVGDDEMFQLYNEANEPIRSWGATHLRQRRLIVDYIGTQFPTISGNVRVGNTIVGEFSNQAPGRLEVNWLVTDYTLPSLGNLITAPGTESPRVSVNVTEPLNYSVFWEYNRLIYNATHTDSVAKFLNQYNVGEFHTDPPQVAKFFRQAQALLQNPSLRPGRSVAQYIKHLFANNVAANYSTISAPTSQEIFNTYHKYVVAHSTEEPQDADFTLQNGVLTNVYNANGFSMLINPKGKFCYQHVRLVSTNRDDDSVGVVFGIKETQESLTFLILALNLAYETGPQVRLLSITAPKPVEYSFAGGASVVNVSTSNTARVLGTMHDSPPTSNTLGANGWLTVPWNQGVYVGVEFLAGVLSVRVNYPGEPASNQFISNVTLTAASEPLLEGARGTNGLFVHSQASSYWHDYTVLDLE